VPCHGERPAAGPDWATEPVDLADADPAWTVRGEQERDHLDERIDRVRRKRLAVGVGALAAYGGADFGDLVSGQRVRCELLSITIARFAEKSTRL
jgi:hypothetical protein